MLLPLLREESQAGKSVEVGEIVGVLGTMRVAGQEAASVSG
jgi:hypothetical protein